MTMKENRTIGDEARWKVKRKARRTGQWKDNDQYGQTDNRRANDNVKSKRTSDNDVNENITGVNKYEGERNEEWLM